MDSEATRAKKRAAALNRSPEKEARRLAASKAALNRPEVRSKLSVRAKITGFGKHERTPEIRAKLREAAALMGAESKAKRIKRSVLARQTPEHSALRSRLMLGNRYGEKNRGRQHSPRCPDRVIRGYRFLYVPNDEGSVGRRPGRWVAEHVLVVERAIGRFLAKGELIHHIDGDKRNNNIGNLFLASGHSQHRRCHASLEETAFELVRRNVICFQDGKYSFVEKQ